MSELALKFITEKNKTLMIKSFKHKGLKSFYDTGNLSGIQAQHKEKIRMQLVALDTATVVDDLDLPGFRLHSLKGNLKGLWAIDVSKTSALLLNLKTAMFIS